MKLFLLINAFAFLLLSTSFAQSVPQGMKYQAVARDSKGQVMANQNISLKITLLNEENKNSYYSEIHTITTTGLGLFTLVIGDGKTEKGEFKNVPWSTQDIWMQVSIKDDVNKAFTIISNSKLLAVPYAFHAATASQLVGATDSKDAVKTLVKNLSDARVPGIPSQTWSLFGNSTSNAAIDKLGTTDFVDLVVVTNNIERMRIYANGNIDIKRSLKVGADLRVDSSVYLNIRNGVTVNNGPFTVGSADRKSPTFLFGNLTVDKDQPTLLGGTLTVDKETDLNSSLNVDGPTDLNSRLNVNYKSPTTLSGTLNVKGITDLDSALNVNKKSPTVLTGTLRVDSNAIFNSPTNSDTLLGSPNGALAISGGVGIAKNATIGGDVRIGGKTTLAGPLRITDATPSTNPETGALTVGGGVGILGNLNVKSATKIFDETQSTATTNGALIVAGGAGIAKNVNIGGTLTTAGITNLNSQVTINANPTGGQDNFTGYPLRVEGGSQGIAVKINGGRTTDNNFISFWDGTKMQGRIEGQTMAEMLDNSDYKFEKRQYEGDIAFGVIDIALAGFDAFQSLTNTVGAATSATACLGLGACVTSPIPSLIASSLAVNIASIANVLFTAAALTFTGVNFADWKTYKAEANGITYESGAGDYAEYLMREKFEERFVPGDIIGLKGGKISKNTNGADKMMVISMKPIVLGNMPSAENAKNYEKVAFLGQVPVKVFGTVNVGDYILANGNNNGVGVAVAQDKLNSKDVKNIVGIAWSSSKQSVGITNINVAVGLNVNDNQKFVEELEKQIVNLQNEISNTNAQLEKLVPGFKAPSSTVAPVLVATNNPKSTNTAPAVPNKNIPEGFTVVPEESSIHYYQITRADIISGDNLAQSSSKIKGIDVESHPFWKKFNSDPSFKEETINKILMQFNHQVNEKKVMNSRASN